MNRYTTTILLALVTAPVATAQDSLLFTTAAGGAAERTAWGSSGTSLQYLSQEDIAVVTPDTAGCSAETYLCHPNLNTLAGDKDNDAIFPQLPLADAIDALLIRKLASPSVRAHQVFFSPKKNIGVSGVTQQLRSGDVGSYRPNGLFARFIQEAQIRSALGILPVWAINVDAVTVDDDENIYLSFEAYVELLGGIPLHDGGVACIPKNAVVYNVDGLVTGVAANSGFVALVEATIDMMVLNSLVADTAGAPVAAIVDLDGLDIDPDGKTLMQYQTHQYGTVTIPHLLFCGKGLSGGAVLSTAAGGSVAQLNGSNLASTIPIATDGTSVGLLPSGSVLGLNGLAVIDDSVPRRFVLDTITPTVAPGGTIEIDVGGADPSHPVQVRVMLGCTAGCAGTTEPSVWLGNPGFPYWFMPPMILPIANADPQGFIDDYLKLAIPGGALMVGLPMVFQAVSLTTDGAGIISAPVTIQVQ